jgi:hypothetical protein
VTLTWQAINYPGPVKYGLEVQRTAVSSPNRSTTVVATSSLTSLSYPLNIAQYDSATYRWRIWAISPSGRAGPMSGWRTFTTSGASPIN